MDFVFKGDFKCTSGYKLPARKDHKGGDYVTLQDKNIYAPCDGEIGSSTRVYTGKTAEWGNYVRFDFPYNAKYYSMFFCHLASRSVKKGQTIKRGDKLGIMGNTGKSTGPHLHLEIRLKGTSTTIDPFAFFNIPNKTFDSYNAIAKKATTVKKLESGNDIVWELMNGKYKVEITEPERAIKALDKAKNDADFMSLYWIIYKMVNGNG